MKGRSGPSKNDSFLNDSFIYYRFNGILISVSLP